MIYCDQYIYDLRSPWIERSGECHLHLTYSVYRRSNYYYKSVRALIAYRISQKSEPRFDVDKNHILATGIDRKQCVTMGKICSGPLTTRNAATPRRRISLFINKKIKIRGVSLCRLRWPVYHAMGQRVRCPGLWAGNTQKPMKIQFLN